jgi:short-subunit dehydrogenase
VRRFAYAEKVCLVTGAAGGIGAALALALARRRCALALLDKDADGLARIAALAAGAGAADVSTWVVDLSDGGDRTDLAQRVVSRHGGVDLLVNNAGVALVGEFAEIGMPDFDWVLEVNLHAVVRLTKAFLPSLLHRPGSHIVVVSSLFGLIAPAGQVAYATSKFAVRGFGEALRHELAGRDVGVTVVHPGGVRTNIAANARIGPPDPDGALAARAKAFTERALTMPPEQAAQLIVAAVAARRARLVISRPAQVGDLLARLAPGRYWDLARRLGGPS